MERLDGECGWLLKGMMILMKGMLMMLMEGKKESEGREGRSAFMCEGKGIFSPMRDKKAVAVRSGRGLCRGLLQLLTVCLPPALSGRFFS